LAFSEVYRKQVEVLIRILPFIAEEDCFALKGGTAINLFVRNMPRLSVDIDLTYLPVLPRAESLAAIDAAMKRIAERIRKGLRGAQVTEAVIQPEKAVTKLLIRVGGVQTKIEVTPVLRGCVYEAWMPTLGAVVQILLLRHHVAHRSRRKRGQFFLLECRHSCRADLRFRFSCECQPGLHKKDRQKSVCGCRIVASGGAHFGIPEVRRIARVRP